MKQGRVLASFVKIIAVLAILLCTAACRVLPSSTAETAKENEQNVISVNDEMKPQDNEGKKWRVAYCESEPYVNYTGNLHGILMGLEEKGWLENLEGLPYEAEQADTKIIWEWLEQNDTGPYLEFVPEQYYCLSTDGDEKIEQMISSLQSGNDFDILLVMGTYAGVVAAENESAVPVLVFSTSNALNAGIVKSENYSGRSKIWAHMDLRRFQRQITVFHDIFDFHKLGIVYEDSEMGRILSAIDDVEKAAAQRNFTVIERHVAEPVSEEDKERYYREMKEAYGELAKEADAMYVTVGSLEADRLEKLFSPFYKNKIPISSQLGEGEVKYGALLSVTMLDFVNIGRFGADTFIKTLKGEDPSKLVQIFESTPRLSINLKAAEKIGYKFPFELLLVADQAFTDIGPGENKNKGAQ